MSPEQILDEYAQIEPEPERPKRVWVSCLLGHATTRGEEWIREHRRWASRAIEWYMNKRKRDDERKSELRRQREQHVNHCKPVKVDVNHELTVIIGKIAAVMCDMDQPTRERLDEVCDYIRNLRGDGGESDV